MMDCIKNLHKCNAECCKLIVFRLEEVEIKNEIDNTMVIKINLNPDQVKYYRFHRCTYERGRLTIPCADYFTKDNLVFINRRCTQLTDSNLCRLHINGLKPKVCYEFNETTCKEKRFFITPNCTLRQNEN